MHCLELSIEESKVRITEHPFDCVWIFLKQDKKRTSIQSSLLQTLDWKMGGSISRLLKQGEPSKETTFIPSMKRIAAQLLALDFHSCFQAEKFRVNIEGLKAKSICCIVENQDDLKQLKKEVEKMKFSDQVEELVFATE